MTPAEPADPSADALGPLRPWVLKQGVGIGGLTEAERELVLALVWAALPAMPGNEAAANAALKAALAGPASFLDTDHVELRRWLVDTGWLRRDGYGREYLRTPLADLADSRRPLAQALLTAGPGWAQAERERHAQARAQRRLAWQSRQGAA